MFNFVNNCSPSLKSSVSCFINLLNNTLAFSLFDISRSLNTCSVISGVNSFSSATFPSRKELSAFLTAAAAFISSFFSRSQFFNNLHI